MPSPTLCREIAASNTTSAVGQGRRPPETPNPINARRVGACVWESEPWCSWPWAWRCFGAIAISLVTPDRELAQRVAESLGPDRVHFTLGDRSTFVISGPRLAP